MPVIVIGADTPTGGAVLDALRHRAGEIRAFVSAESAAETLRPTEVKVATGDLSDTSHVEAACMNCFCAVLVTESAVDGRELAFASSHQEVIAGWRSAIKDAGVTRAIWIDSPAVSLDAVDGTAPEARLVSPSGRSLDEIAAEVADLDEAGSI
jgi:putative NADH-flavin reductase